jgi:hypothetical protein
MIQRTPLKRLICVHLWPSVAKKSLSACPMRFFSHFALKNRMNAGSAFSGQ